MPTPIILKNSSQAGKIPTTNDLLTGEVAFNTADNKLFLKNNLGVVVDLLDFNNLTGTLSVSKGGTGSSSPIIVNLTTDQTIGGVKTFTLSPIVPLATTPNQAVRLGQITPSLLGNLTAQWNANRIQGIPIDITNLAEGNVFIYNSALNKLEPTSITTAITNSGTVNSASNVGTLGVGIFKNKVGDNLQYKKVNPASNKLTIVDDTANDKIDIDVNVSNININETASILGVNKGGTGSSIKTFIDLSTAQTVEGIKTFNVPPVIPLATTNNQAARLDQITAARVSNTTAQWNSNQLQGRAVSSTAPVNNDILLYNNVNWVPTPLSSLKTTEAELNLNNLIGILSIAKGGTGTSNQTWIDLTTAQNISGVKTFIDSPIIPAATSNNQAANLSQITSLRVGRDNPLWNANQLQSKNISTTLPTNGQAIVYDSINNVYKPGGVVGSGSGSGDALSFKGIALDDTNKIDGYLFSYSLASNNYELAAPRLFKMDDIDEASVNYSTLSDKNIWAYNQSISKWTNYTLSDLGLDQTAANASKIQNIPVAINSPLNKQVLTYNSATSSLELQTPSSNNITFPITTAQGGTGLATAPTNNQILLGNATGGYSLTTLSQGTGITFNNTGGVLTISSTVAPATTTLSKLNVTDNLIDAGTNNAFIKGQLGVGRKNIEEFYSTVIDGNSDYSGIKIIGGTGASNQFYGTYCDLFVGEVIKSSFCHENNRTKLISREGAITLNEEATMPNVGIGCKFPEAKLQVTGGMVIGKVDAIPNPGLGNLLVQGDTYLGSGMRFKWDYYSANTTLTKANAYVGVDSAATNLIVTLPDSKIGEGTFLVIKRLGGGNNTVTINSVLSQVIDTTTTFVLNSTTTCVTLISYFTGWAIVSKF